MPPVLEDVTATRQRLLEAAGEVFAEQGFARATVRAICLRAQANIAAVNYHFGDKAGLYQEVLRYAQQRAIEKYPPNLGVTATSTAEQKLAAYVRAFLLRLTDTGRPAWHSKLMAREMAEPTAALDALVERGIRPQFEHLRTIVRDLVGPGPTDTEISAAARSVVGQLLYYYFARSVIDRLEPELRLDSSAVEPLTEHITRFSLAALRGYAATTLPACGPAD